MVERDRQEGPAPTMAASAGIHERRVSLDEAAVLLRSRDARVSPTRRDHESEPRRQPFVSGAGGFGGPEDQQGTDHLDPSCRRTC